MVAPHRSAGQAPPGLGNGGVAAPFRNDFRIGLTPFERDLLVSITEDDLDELWQLELQLGKAEVVARRLLLQRLRRNLQNATRTDNPRFVGGLRHARG